MNDTPGILFLERLAFNTWPAFKNWKYDDWTVRCTGPYTKRANSVFTPGEMPRSVNWLDEIEAYYSRNGVLPQFHVSPVSPPELDPILAESGYTKEMITSLYTASCAETVNRIEFSEQASQQFGKVTVTCQEQCDDEWLDAFLQAEQFGTERRTFYEGLFERISPQASFVSVNVDGRPAGIGTVILERGWAGLVNVAIHPEFRRQGLGRKLLHGMALWSLQNRAERLYLQVLADNAPAIALYRSAGFIRQYDYHYRIKYNS